MFFVLCIFSFSAVACSANSVVSHGEHKFCAHAKLTSGAHAPLSAPSDVSPQLLKTPSLGSGPRRNASREQQPVGGGPVGLARLQPPRLVRAASRLAESPNRPLSPGHCPARYPGLHLGGAQDIDRNSSRISLSWSFFRSKRV